MNVALISEVRKLLQLALITYLVFTVAIPAINVLLFAEQVANDALQATVTYIGSWWY